MDADSLKKLFGRRLRSLRQLRDITQEGLAEEAGLSVEYVSRIERGLASPSFNTIVALSEALSLKPKQLFDFTPLDRRGN